MKKGFTLIELLAVVAIIAILAIVVVLTINPTELLRQGRDATRVSDMGTINKVVSLYYQDAMNSPSTMFMGTSSVIYVSVPDPTATSTAGNACTGLGLPTPPTGYTYHCAASSTYMSVNGTGWIPINFNSYSAGTVTSKIPVDPINTTSTNLYYTYETDGVGGFKVASFFESQKYAPQMANDSGNDPELYEKGSNLALASGRGLVGYWNLDEGSGSTANDASGRGKAGTLLGTSTPAWLSASNCKMGNSCLNFSNGYVLANGAWMGVTFTTYTLTGWIKASTTVGTQIFESFGLPYLADNAGKDFFSASISSTQVSLTGKTTLTPGVWYFIVASWDGSNMNLYVNGILDAHQAESGTVGAVSSLYLGNHSSLTYQFFGSLDDIRVYNRALSAAEIQEMYNAEK